MAALVKSPKVSPLPQQPQEETVKQAGDRERRKLLRTRTETILTSPQGVSPTAKRTLLGGK